MFINSVCVIFVISTFRVLHTMLKILTNIYCLIIKKMIQYMLERVHLFFLPEKAFVI